MHEYAMFGLRVLSPLPFPGCPPRRIFPDAIAKTGAGPTGGLDPGSTTRVALCSAAEVTDAFSGPAGAAVARTGGGETITVQPGRAGDVLLRMTAETGTCFHIQSGGESVRCAVDHPEAPGWQRALLDTVLGTAALLQGLEALHAAAVRLPGGAVVAIASPTSGGKSTLCAELITRGARLFSDDLVFLSRERGGVVAHPGPPVMNVPSNRGAALVATGAAARLARFGDEDWLTLRRSCSRPAALAAVIRLERSSDQFGVSLQDEPRPGALLATGIESGGDPARLQARFELMGDLAATVPQFLLSAPAAEPPGSLATLIEASLPELPAAGAR
jgi:hypothetical protein